MFPRFNGAGLWVVAVLAPLLVVSMAQSVARDPRRVAAFTAWEVTRVRVLTWNVGRVYILGESRAADGALAHISGVIADLDPDVVALQELRDGSQLDEVVGMLRGRYQGLSADHHRSDRVVGVLARPGARFEPVTIASGRTALLARVPTASGEAAVVSVHLDAFQPDRRRRQAEELAIWSRSWRGPLIIAGDFNFDPQRSPVGGLDEQTYRLLRIGFRDVGAEAGPTALLGRRIDLVLVRDAGLRGARARVLPNRRLGWMDHDPLLADLELYESAPVL